MTFEKFMQRLGAYLLVSLLVGIVLSLTIVSSFSWVFGLSLLIGLPVIFVESKPLTFGYVVAIWVALFIVYATPHFFPGIYDGVTSGAASVDHKTGKLLRAGADSKNRISTDAGCREVIDENNKNYDNAINAVLNSKDTPGEKADQIAKLKKDADAELQKIKSSCDEAPTFSEESPKVISAVYNVPSTSSTSSSSGNGKTTRVTIDANKPLTDTGIDLDGKKRVTVTVVGSDCWDNGGQNPFRQCGEGIGPFPGTVIPNLPIGELIAKVGSTYQPIGRSATIASSHGRLMLGMNDIPGQFYDNHGSLPVDITVE